MWKWTARARVRNPKIEIQLKRNMWTREGKQREQRSRGGAGNWGRVEPRFHMDNKMLMRPLVHAKCMTRGRWKQIEGLFLPTSLLSRFWLNVEAASNLQGTFEHQLLGLLRVCENKHLECMSESFSEGIEHATCVVILISTTFPRREQFC
jgi:hypothetical protein